MNSNSQQRIVQRRRHTGIAAAVLQRYPGRRPPAAIHWPAEDAVEARRSSEESDSDDRRLVAFSPPVHPDGAVRRRRPERRWDSGPSAWAAIVVLGLGIFARPSMAQVTWLNPEDGEILNVSSADGPPPGRPFFQFRHGEEVSDARGTVTFSRLRLLYAVTPKVTLGVSTVHLDQILGDLQKRGMGDTQISLKLHYQPWPEQPIRVGLRQSLSLPTGYDQEHDGLQPFTSRRNDYAVQGLAQYVTPKFAAYLNPGLLLPGGDVDSYVTGGIGLGYAFPMGLDVRGEYFSRWSMVSHDFESDIFVTARKNLFWGLAVEGGVKRRLLQESAIDPEVQLGLTLGRDRSSIGELYSFRQRSDTGLLVHELRMIPEDPHGVGRELMEAFRSTPGGGKDQPLVYVRPGHGGDLASAAPAGLGRPPVSRGGVYEILPTPRNYELNITILRIEDGEIGGLDLGPIARVARAKTHITAQCELIAPDGYSVLTRRTYRGSASRTLSAVLAPDSGSIESMVTPDETRASLREAAARDLMRQIRDDAIRTIQLRDYQ